MTEPILAPTDLSVPNHHADHPGFSGISGTVLALVFAVGRGRAARVAADLADVAPGDHVVDVGCGPGTALRIAARRGASGVGVDPAPVMRRVARALTRPGRPIRWAPGVAEDLPVPDGAATVVWSMATVHHWQDVEQGLAEAHRVLAPGGRLLAVERRTVAGAEGRASHGWVPAQAEAFAVACRHAGFTDVAVRTERVRSSDQLVVLATRP
ncbi:class I SAM-dependent methyltransferase [Iamia sp. SCSIO 61187]|uniref:class I SAM-dependent methyltransferase n=1 Tax=Iamia sp. SCSIO 61187 TaxID=2722752 RepID=UPI001C6350DF|nr:class I SAM-dependent methyltransferase [Iamia sp. SCSIO 61187]QYG93292.1 class I SAM-dependent methyltransferase [Iamia sp. SCSIO 61187]